MSKQTNIKDNQSTESVQIKKTYDTSKPVIVKTSEDKLRLLLQKYLKKVEKKKEVNTPVGILISLIITFATSTPKSAFGLSADVWRAFLILTLISVFVWLIFTVKNALNKADVEDIINDLKSEE